MLQRTRKQITYAAGALIVAGLLLGGAGILRTAGQPKRMPSPTPTPAHSPITVEETTVIRHIRPEGAGEAVDIVTRLKNPNAAAGVKAYAVTFILVEPHNAILKQHIEETYLPAGSLQYVMALNVSLGRKQLKEVEVQLPPSPTFLALPDTLSRPSFSTFMRGRSERLVGSQTLEEQVGVIKNTGTFTWQTVDVSVIGLNATGQVIAAGKTSVGALTVGEEREFTVQWPKPREPVIRVVVLPTTNVYRDENFIRTIGDPALLQ